MSKSKKVLSLALALVMALSVFAMASFATVTTPTATVTVAADVTSVANGDTVTITVKAVSAEDFYAGPMSLPITYDNTLFTFVSATINDVFGAGVTEKITNTATAGKVILTAVPKTDGTPVAPNLNGNETVIATLTFTASATEGTGTFAIDADQKTTSNPTGKFYIGSFDGSDAKTAELTTMGQTLNTVSVDVAYASANPELVLTATGETNGIKIDTNKTFGGTYAGAVYGFSGLAFMNTNYLNNNLTVTNGGSMSFSRSIGTTGYGTGTVISVKNSGGTTVAQYVVIIFGDVNGDGRINTNDASTAKSYVANQSSAPEGSVKRMAVNCAGANAAQLRLLNTADASAVKAYVGSQMFTNVNLATLTSRHFAATANYA